MSAGPRRAPQDARLAFTPSEIRRVLRRLGHTPRKKRGQHFLADANVTEKTLRWADIRPQDKVVEIGPGLGSLTRSLLAAGAEVFAVELEPAFVSHLKSSTDTATRASFHLVEGDAVKFPLASIASDLRAAEGDSATIRNSIQYEGKRSASIIDCKVVANLPYAISTPWLSALLEGPLPNHLILILQRETAQRFTAKHGTKDFSALSVRLQSAYNRVGAFSVSRNCFVPRPAVDSTVLHLVRKAKPFQFSHKATRSMRACFTHRRKQIVSIGRKYPELNTWMSFLESTSGGTSARPEEIPIPLWQKLDQFLFSQGPRLRSPGRTKWD